MFDISWSELLILGIVTLVFVGPKELPGLMRTIGKYAGVARRHANEFKSQFDAAMREAELDSMREEVEKMQTSINAEVMQAKSSIADAGKLARIETPSVQNTVVDERPARTAEKALPPMPEPPRMES